MPVNWTAENDRKLLLNLITTLSTKDINAEALASLFPGATPKAILERVAKLRRELKAANGATGATAKAATTAPAIATVKDTTTKPATTSPGTIKAAIAKAVTAKAATTGRKRGRQVEEGDAVEDGAVKKRVRGRTGQGRGHGEGLEGQGVGEGVVVKSEGCGGEEDRKMGRWGSWG